MEKIIRNIVIEPNVLGAKNGVILIQITQSLLY